MKKHISILAFCFLAFCSFAQKANLVNPFVGTDFHGHTYPGAVAPFGMVQLSPDTRLEGWDGCSGYHYSDNMIYGFSHTHLSGTGVEDLCDILFTPTTLDKNAKSFAFQFKHKNENAHAGYYSVRADNGIFCELTATKRGGYHKYTYPDNNQTMAIVIDMKHRDKTLDWNVEIKDDVVYGYRNSKAWSDQQHIYFAAKFSKKMQNTYLDEKNGKLYIFFGKSDAKNNVVEAYVALSSVDKDGALKNLNAETSKDFASARKEVEKLWNKALGTIEIEGGTKEQQVTFYTSLYHCMIAPNIYSDVDGRYRGMLNEKIDGHIPTSNICTANNYTRYTIFSMWDTYRALNPLLTIIQPNLCRDFASTFIDAYKQYGELPMWELHAWETHCMIGAHGVSALAEMWEKVANLGVSNEDVLESLIGTVEVKNRGQQFFNKYGFIASEDEHESVSKTVELAYNMFCVAKVAKDMGKMDIYNKYIEKAQYYKNLFNPKNTFIQPKENGRFIPNFDPKQVDINYTEGNGWHYTFYVPQDINTLIDMMGGEQAFNKKLDECFNSSEKTTGREQADVTGLIGQYAHGNEPSQHTAYLYNYSGEAYKTQKLVRQILTTLYSDKPDGVCGNDDCGQMAAWYVLSALGFYPVSPVSGEYIIGSPLFDKATINLENGKKFVIKSKQGKDTPYVKSMKLNGKNHTKTFISHGDILKGGTLEFAMSATPNKELGKKAEDRPVARITDNIIKVSDFLEYEGTGTFTGELEVSRYIIDDNYKAKKIETRYIGNNSPKDQTYNLDQESKFNGTREYSAVFYKIPEGRSIKILTNYSPQYTAGGDNALIDLKRGSDNWRIGCWQGYWGEDVEAVIDLGEKKEVKKIGGHFMQDQKAWIFAPIKVEYYVSDDGENFTLVETVNSPIPEKADGAIPHIFYTSKPFMARYVKMKAVNRKVNPEWHLSPGEKSWLFIDEIEIDAE